MSKVFSSSLFYLFVNWTSFIHLIFCSTQRTFNWKKLLNIAFSVHICDEPLTPSGLSVSVKKGSDSAVRPEAVTLWGWSSSSNCWLFSTFFWSDIQTMLFYMWRRRHKRFLLIFAVRSVSVTQLCAAHVVRSEPLSACRDIKETLGSSWRPVDLWPLCWDVNMNVSQRSPS